MPVEQTLSLSDLIEEALAILYRVTERPLQVVMGTNDLGASTSDVTFTVTDASAINPPVPVEFGQELVLVTAKSDAATPVLTASRAYAGTPAAAHAEGSVGLINPQWPRREVRRGVLRCIRGPLNTYVPRITSAVYTPTSGKFHLTLPEETLRVFRVGFTKYTPSGLSTETEQWREVSQWDYVADVPTEVASTGKMLAFPPGFANPSASGSSTQKFYITHQLAWAWSGGTHDPAEAETIKLPVGAEDLPALYAAAFLLARRELTRLEVDKIEEWSQEASIRQGINMRAIQQLWQEFYRRVDEVHRLQTIPRHRPFRAIHRW